MEADGSIVIDTKIDESGMDVGVNDIKKSLKNIVTILSDISSSAKEVVNVLSSGLQETSKQAVRTAKKLDDVAEAAKEIDDIKITYADDTISSSEDALRAPEPISESDMQYNQDAIKFIEEYAQKTDEAAQSTNDFKSDIEDAQKELDKLAESGKWFGDSDYDAALQKLQEAKQIAKEYQADLTSQKNIDLFGLDSIEGKIEQAKMSLRQLTQMGFGIESADVQAAVKNLADLEAEYRSLAMAARKSEEEVNSFATGSAKASLFIGNLGRRIKDAAVGFLTMGRSANQSKSGLLSSLGTVLKYAIGVRTLFAAVRMASKAVAEGMQNLAQVSGSTNTSISSMISALTYLKNSFAAAFAPILTVVAPIVTTFINLVAQAVTYIGMFFAALTGASSFKRAIPVQEDFAAGLEDTADSAGDAADATEDAAKAAEDYLSPLDEISKFQDNSSDSGGGGSGGKTPKYTPPSASEMFEDVPIEPIASDLADKVKAIFAQIFEPFKEAWASEGQKTIDAAKYALESLGQLASSVGQSMLEVWTNGTGTQMITTMLQIAQDLLFTIGNIATQWNTAWNTDNLGTQVVQNIAILLQIALDTIHQITAGTREWSASLDVTPLLASINTVLAALQPISQTVGSGLAWLWNNVLLPLAGWTITDLLPSFLNSVASALTLLNQVITALQPLGQWLWDSFLAPLASWTGDAIIAGLETINNLFTVFGDWISEHQELVQGFVTVLGSLALAVGIVTGAVSLFNGVVTAASAVANGLQLAVAALTSPFGIVVVVIGAVIAAGVLLYKNWDTICEHAAKLKDWVVNKVTGIKDAVVNAFNSMRQRAAAATAAIGAVVMLIWSGIQSYFESFITWLRDVFETDWTQIIGTDLGNILNDFFDGLQQTWQGVQDAFNGVIDFIKDVFTGDWEEAWEDVKKIFSGVFDALEGIAKAPINAVIDLINKMIRGVQDGINYVIDAANNISFSIPDWVPGIGGKHFGIDINHVKLNTIPRLASGAVIPPKSEFLAVLGDQNRGTNIETPEALLRKIIREELGSNSGSKGGIYKFTAQINRRTLFEEVMEEGRMYQAQSGINPFALE